MKLLLLVLLAMPSLSALAGTPDQDLIVDVMRERFKSGSTSIADSDLAPGKNWRCVYYTAQKNIVPNYGNYHSLFQFNKDKDSNVLYSNQGMFPVSYFVLNSQSGFVGSAGDEQVYARKASNGALVFEDTTPQTPYPNQAYVSVSNPNLVGKGYIYCKLPQ